MAVAFQGAPGAFSHEACLAFLPDHEPAPVDTFEGVFERVRDGRCALAMLPVENSTAGPVPEVARLLPGSGLRVIGEHWLPVRLQLLAAEGATFATLRTAESHPMALKQCRRGLRALGLQAVESFDTAGAAREVAAARDPRRAAVASRAAAAIYGLVSLREDIEDGEANQTRFVVVARG